jgi:hypothetical protein
LQHYEFPDNIFKGSDEDIARIKEELAGHGRR